MSIHQALKSSGVGIVDLEDRDVEVRASGSESSTATLSFTLLKSGGLIMFTNTTAFPIDTGSTVEGNDLFNLNDWLVSGQEIYSLKLDIISGSTPDFTIGGVAKSNSTWHDIDGDVVIGKTMTRNTGGSNVFSTEFTLSIAFSSDTSTVLKSANYIFDVIAVVDGTGDDGGFGGGGGGL